MAGTRSDAEWNVCCTEGIEHPAEISQEYYGYNVSQCEIVDSFLQISEINSLCELCAEHELDPAAHMPRWQRKHGNARPH